MLVENSSDIVKDSQVLTLSHGESVEALKLINGQILVLAYNNISLFKNIESIEDPLASGLLHSAELSDDVSLKRVDDKFMAMNSAGVIGLFDEKIILITPNDIQLFPNRACALRNQDEIMSFHLG